MALHYDLTKVADVEALHADDGEWAKTEAIIFATMIVYFGEISVKNWREFYLRLHMVEQALGPFAGEQLLTPADVQRRVGLRVNVNDSLANFKKHLLAVLRREAEHRLRAWEEKTCSQDVKKSETSADASSTAAS